MLPLVGEEEKSEVEPAERHDVGPSLAAAG
jgi:hypothetical protein